jgi:hypothetical protein
MQVMFADDMAVARLRSLDGTIQPWLCRDCLSGAMQAYGVANFVGVQL